MYLSIGNIDKDLCRKTSAHAFVLVGYIPVAKLECFSPARRAVEGYRLFHRCMASLLDPLVEAGRTGIDMVCADGFIHRVYPILAAYIADHPEQCLISCCRENYCPKCTVQPDQRGDLLYSVLKDPPSVLDALEQAANGNQPPTFNNWGLRRVSPFWQHLPNCDIFACITPDILHQLHKGLFKDHLVAWATTCALGGAAEIDQRFRTMSKHPNIQHFHKGIFLVSQWTGTEYKNMEKVFLGVIAGAADERVIMATHANLDFIYYAHFEVHTADSLAKLQAVLEEFHLHKHVFIECGIRHDFNFPKAHSPEHYRHAIETLGTAGGYSTEGPERLHINFAKVAYGTSNKNPNYPQQKGLWLDRQEAIYKFQSYLKWVLRKQTPSKPDMPAPSQPKLAPQASATHADDHNIKGDTGDEETPVLSAVAPGYRIAKHAAFPAMAVASIVQDLGAQDFVHCANDYLHAFASHPHCIGSPTPPALLITPETRLDIFTQFKLELPLVSQVTCKPVTDTIHAHPVCIAQGLQLAREANFSTVLVRTATGSRTLPSNHPLYCMSTV